MNTAGPEEAGKSARTLRGIVRDSGCSPVRTFLRHRYSRAAVCIGLAFGASSGDCCAGG